jgi:Asp/Glu/hydantoin racemase
MSPGTHPRIALIHATPVSMDPIHAAFASAWPDARTVNILDDSLADDRARTQELTDQMFERFAILSRYAFDTGADAILFTCSAFGLAIERAAQRLPIPVLKPNEAMFEAAMSAGARIGMLTTFEPSVAPLQLEFDEAAASRQPRPRLKTVVVEEAMQALRAGDVETHNRLLAEKVGELGPCDAVMLAQFSTSRAAKDVRAKAGVPVLTAPDAAVAKLRRLIGGVRK